MLNKLGVAFKTFFMLVLFFVFLKYFGIVQIQDYLERGVLVKVGKAHYNNGVTAPKIRICAMNPSTGYGWKPEAEGQNRPGLSSCQAETSLPEKGNRSTEDENLVTEDEANITKCLENHIYNMEDFLPYGTKPFQNPSSDITAFDYGNCVSFETNQTLNSMIGFSDIKLVLNSSLDYVVFLYDSNYFFISENPRATPALRLEISALEMSNIMARYLKFEIIEHILLNLPKNPCVEDDKGYNFENCIRKSVEARVGCRLPWHQDFENEVQRTCSALSKFWQHDREYRSIASNELRIIIKDSGCQIPCTYREFRDIP